MSRVVLKYPIPPCDRYGITTHANPRVLHVGNQREAMTLWIEQDAEGPADAAVVDVAVFATGQDLSPDRAYIGTVMLHNAALVFHLYARIHTTRN